MNSTYFSFEDCRSYQSPNLFQFWILTPLARHSFQTTAADS